LEWPALLGWLRSREDPQRYPLKEFTDYACRIEDSSPEGGFTYTELQQHIKRQNAQTESFYDYYRRLRRERDPTYVEALCQKLGSGLLLFSELPRR
jgi:hypothetical protein